MKLYNLLLCLMIGCGLPLYTLAAQKPHKTEKHHSKHKKSKKKHKKKKGNKGKHKKQTKSKGKAPAPSSARPHPNCYWVLPGHLLGGAYPKQDKFQKCIDAGVTFFLDLTEKGEHGLKSYMTKKAGAVKHVRMPIKDHCTPTPEFMKQILDTIDNALAQGHVVYVHCHAGVGRTGTVIASYLIRHGLTGQKALEKLAELWKAAEQSKKYRQSPGNAVQRSFVNNYSEK